MYSLRGRYTDEEKKREDEVRMDESSRAREVSRRSGRPVTSCFALRWKLAVPA